MKEFVSHIDYLIQKHDCVIIPGFGGFVLNHEGSSIAADGAVLPPKVSVGFNPSLKSNDGLLAESYMTMYSISYDEACQKIELAVKRLNTILGMKHPVQIGRLGKLSLENDRLVFIPNANLSIFHPDTFGLSTVNMKRLSDIEREKAKTKRRTILKRVFAGAGAAAAAILIFFVASTPVSENDEAQKSSFLSDWISSLPASSDAMDIDNNTEHIVTLPENTDIEEQVQDSPVVEPEALNAEIAPKAEEEAPVVAEPSKHDYYVVIAGATSQPEAQRLINKFKSQGFENLGSLSSKKRIRIYAASFASRQEAEKYLVAFKAENPKFYDAWVYHQK